MLHDTTHHKSHNISTFRHFPRKHPHTSHIQPHFHYQYSSFGQISFSSASVDDSLFSAPALFSFAPSSVFSFAPSSIFLLLPFYFLHFLVSFELLCYNSIFKLRNYLIIGNTDSFAGFLALHVFGWGSDKISLRGLEQIESGACVDRLDSFGLLLAWD